MVWNGNWNGTKISVWNGPMEDVRMEWNGRFQEWNGRQSSILDFAHGISYTEKYIWIVITKNIRKHLAANHLSTN